MDLVKFDRDLEDQREFDEKCAEFFVGSALVGDVASVSWKLFLCCQSRGGQVLKKALLTRVDLFNNGQWSELVKMSVTSFYRCRQCSGETLKGSPEGHCGEKGSRIHMAQLGDVSTNRQALEGASLTTSDERTLKAFERPRAAPCSTVRAESRVVCEERSYRTIQHDHGPPQTSGTHQLRQFAAKQQLCWPRTRCRKKSWAWWVMWLEQLPNKSQTVWRSKFAPHQDESGLRDRCTHPPGLDRCGPEQLERSTSSPGMRW